MNAIIRLMCLPFNFVSLKPTAKVGLPPIEVTRYSKSSLDKGAVFPAKLSSTRYRQRTLIKGGLEIHVR